MDVTCAQCGEPLQRPPSRIKANPSQFCDRACLTAFQTRRSEVVCAMCGKRFEVRPSRVGQNATNVCSEPCRRERIRLAHVARLGSAETRLATCTQCGKPIARKPSQLTKYATNFCGRVCKARYGSRPRPDPVTGEWVPCETCGKQVWRTPAIRHLRTFCSRKCMGLIGGQRTGRRKPYTTIICATCGKVFDVIPARAHEARYCGLECKVQGFIAATRASAAARKGKTGTPWTETQRQTLSTTLKRKYDAEWADKPARHSARMTAVGNPQWQDGRTLLPYAPGFTRHLKRKIRERDGYRCRVCGIPQSTGNWLPVHHIDWGKTNHNPSNLITLCHVCHGLVHQKKISLLT